MVGDRVPDHAVFLDGVTGYVGQWTLFWLLEELPGERVAVLIRPSSRGADAEHDVRRRLEQVLRSIGMEAERHRVTAIPGDLDAPLFGNPEAVDALRAPTWMHIAADVRFKKLGARRHSATNRDHTVGFVETARHARYAPGTVCHTSTFYTFEKAGPPHARYEVPEEFHDPAQMQHHNAYGLSKLEAETYLRDEVRSGALPFTLLVFRPDIVAHHIPVAEVARRNPGLLIDDFRVMYGLVAALAGYGDFGLAGNRRPGGGLPDQRVWKYLPMDGETQVYSSDVDSIARAMAHLAILYGAGALTAEKSYRIFNLVNRWRPLRCADLRKICAEVDPEAAEAVQTVSPDAFYQTILPGLPAAARMYFTTFVEPFVGYLNRPSTDAATHNVDAALGEDWHNLHPRHGIDLRAWFKAGMQQAMERRFGQAALAAPRAAAVQRGMVGAI
jgi:hypothetical protein